MGKRNVYNHEVKIVEKLTIENSEREIFKRELEKIPYLCYEVEQLSDGRKILITKPGGKFTYGQIKREDFMVWIYDPQKKTLWLISHKDIYSDLEEKGKEDPKETIKIIDLFERVFNGEEPDEVLKKVTLKKLPGEDVEVLLKAYKWIWGQEDCNYPNGKGRNMSMSGLIELKEKLGKK